MHFGKYIETEGTQMECWCKYSDGGEYEQYSKIRDKHIDYQPIEILDISV